MAKCLINLPSNDASIFVRDEGRGFPLLIMHGGPGADHSTMLSLLPLRNAFRLIFYDHRCNGRSTRDDVETMNWANLAADAEAIRQNFGIDKWAVLGHSFGGMVALEYAIRYPNNLTHLILIDTAGDSAWVRKNAALELEKRGFSGKVVATAKRFYTGQITKREFIPSMAILGSAYYSHPHIAFLLKEALHGIKIKANAEACIYGFKHLLVDWTVMDKLKQIRAHTLIIAGADDFQFTPEHQTQLENGIRGSIKHIIMDAGHNSPTEKPDEIIHLIRDFLEKDNA